MKKLTLALVVAISLVGVPFASMAQSPTAASTSRDNAVLIQQLMALLARLQAQLAALLRQQPIKAPSASLKVLSPNGGEEVPQGETMSVSWTNTTRRKVTIELDRNRLDGAFILANSVSWAGDNQAFYAPTKDITPGEYYLRVCLLEDNGGYLYANCDTSDAPFEIVTDPTLNALSVSYVQSPANERNIVHPGERAIVYGRGLTLGNNYVRMTGMGKDNRLATYGWNYYNTQFTVPDVPAGDYDLSVEQLGGLVKSNHIQVRVVSEKNPSITITSPNGGEEVLQGPYRDITYRLNAPGSLRSPSVQLFLTRYGTTLGKLLNGILSPTPSDPSSWNFSWFVPRYYDAAGNLASALPGDGYRIRGVLAEGNVFIGDDMSDSSFSISYAGATKAVLLTPVNGETLRRGSPSLIGWSYTGNEDIRLYANVNHNTGYPSYSAVSGLPLPESYALGPDIPQDHEDQHYFRWIAGASSYGPLPSGSYYIVACPIPATGVSTGADCSALTLPITITD